MDKTNKKFTFFDKIKFIFSLNLFKTIQLNFFSKKVIRDHGSYIFIYPGTRIVLRRGSTIVIKGKGYLNLGLRGQFEPKRHTDLIIFNGGSWINQGKTDVLSGSYICINGGATLKTASSFLVENNIRCFKEISIGEGTMVGVWTRIMDSNMHGLSLDGNDKERDKPISIGNHSWIGANCLILKGVNIGDNSVVQAGSTIVSNVDSNSLVSSTSKPSVLFLGDIKVTK